MKDVRGFRLLRAYHCLSSSDISRSMWTKIIISIAVGSVLAWVFGFGVTDVLIRDLPAEGSSSFGKLREGINHGHAYALCGLIVFACAMPIALNIPIFQKETETVARVLYTFIVLFLPASFGVWCALPRKPK